MKEKNIQIQELTMEEMLQVNGGNDLKGSCTYTRKSDGSWSISCTIEMK